MLCTLAGSWYLVLAVVEGAGLGHYRLVCERMGKTRPVEADDVGRAIFGWRWAKR